MRTMIVAVVLAAFIIIPVAAVAIWALVLFGSYRYAERIFLIFQRYLVEGISTTGMKN